MIVAFQRPIKVGSVPPWDSRPTVSLVCNGMDVMVNCLLGFPQGGDPACICPSLTDDITDYVPAQSCGRIAAFDETSVLFTSSNDTLSKRQSGNVCTLPPNGGGGIRISFTMGPTVAPTCANADGCGGKVCTGYWCDLTPTGFPPAYQDTKAELVWRFGVAHDYLAGFSPGEFPTDDHPAVKLSNSDPVYHAPDKGVQKLLRRE
ncbi:hypothetical protein HD806DRAFT_517262 [Xylariaceae sp. AK1471]|nr:hypothetical protein HD806DRAFT_517262 [Xylariaceae sp. AK1471]